jgi:hypothetical protein
VARAVRIEYGGAFYHVMARGNRRERIFRNEADRLLFYQTLTESRATTTRANTATKAHFICACPYHSVIAVGVRIGVSQQILTD